MTENSIEEYKKRINKVLDYITSNLSEDLSISKLAHLSCLSEFHFHRIFTALVGESVGMYQRRVRLEKVAYMLRFNQSMSITDIAFSLGFNSSQAFNRAFKNHFGYSPKEERNKSSYNQQIDKLISNNAQTPASIKSWEIKLLPTVNVYFYRYKGSYKKNAVKEHWCNHINDASSKGIINNNSRYIGIVYDDPDITNEMKCRYDCCISTDNRNLPNTKEIEGGIYAVFDFEGNIKEDMPNAFQWIYGVWLPLHGYEPDNRPAYNDYYDFKKGQGINKQNLVKYKFCLPVIKISY